MAIDPLTQQVATLGSLINATADFGDGKPVTRTGFGLYFLRRAP